MITDADVAEFQSLYQRQFGRPIEKQEAFKQLTMLVRQMEIVYQPIKRANDMNEYGVCNDKTEQEPRQNP